MDNLLKCKICDSEFKDVNFHYHLRTHKISQVNYYHTYYPRYDKHDNSLITYKNKDQYFTTDFNSWNNFKIWFMDLDNDNKRLYVLDFLMKRKSKKGLTYAPSQAELKTLMMPGIKFMDDNFDGGYAKIAEEVGLIYKFNNISLDSSLFKDISNKVIFRDTREQQPLGFDLVTRAEALPFGDYRMAGSEVYIERKSLGDAWGTLTGGFERFEREILRAKGAGAYLVVLVEHPFTALAEYPFMKRVAGKIRIPVEFVYHSIRELMQKYEHIQFLFVRDRAEASRVTKLLFAADKQIRKVDLQLLYDKGQL